MNYGSLLRSQKIFPLAFVCTIVFPLFSSAVEFVIVGPRAVGMGGAGITATTDPLATYWNPAGLGGDLRSDSCREHQ